MVYIHEGTPYPGAMDTGQPTYTLFPKPSTKSPFRQSASVNVLSKSSLEFFIVSIPAESLLPRVYVVWTIRQPSRASHVSSVSESVLKLRPSQL